MKYLSRIVDAELDLRLCSVGAALIVGPKWCGKTTTAKQQAKSKVRNCFQAVNACNIARFRTFLRFFPNDIGG